MTEIEFYGLSQEARTEYATSLLDQAVGVCARQGNLPLFWRRNQEGLNEIHTALSAILILLPQSEALAIAVRDCIDQLNHIWDMQEGAQDAAYAAIHAAELSMYIDMDFDTGEAIFVAPGDKDAQKTNLAFLERIIVTMKEAEEAHKAAMEAGSPVKRSVAQQPVECGASTSEVGATDPPKA